MAAAVGKPTEGGDVVTTIMATKNVGDPTGITAGRVMDMMMMGNNAQRQWYGEGHDERWWRNERWRRPQIRGGNMRRGYATTSQTRGPRKA